MCVSNDYKEVIMNLIKNAIETMYKYHECYKVGNDGDSEAIEKSINVLPESQRNFVLVTSQMDNWANVYPVADVLSDKYSLADLLMAYHLYLKEKNNIGNKDDVITEADRFYGVY